MGSQATHSVRRRHSIASHCGVFVLGAMVATATFSQAKSSSQDSAKRYAALDSFAQALSLIANSHVDTVDEQTLIYGGITGMVGALDPYSAFYNPTQYKRLRQDTEGEFGGIGVTLGESDGTASYPLIESVVAGSPAFRAGLRAGDGIVSVDGEATVVDKQPRASATAWHSRIRGPAGTRIELSIVRTSWKSPHDIVLVRQRVAIPSVTSTRYGKVVYIAIRRFREATTRDLHAVLREQMKIPDSRLILDLRNNPGGLLNRGISVADTFLKSGVIVSIESRGGKDVEVARAHSPKSYTGFPMVVLVDENSASASEIVAAALHDHKRATLIGQRTFGKGSVQTFLDLKDGSGLKLTTSRYLTPKGRLLQGRGIDPDIVVDAFAPMMVTPKKANSPKIDEASKGKSSSSNMLSAIQREQLNDDLQLFKSYQYLTRE